MTMNELRYVLLLKSCPDFRSEMLHFSYYSFKSDFKLSTFSGPPVVRH